MVTQTRKPVAKQPYEAGWKTAPKLAFLLGFDEDFRQEMTWPKERDMQATVGERRSWIDATLAAYHPGDEHPVFRVDPGYVFPFFSAREQKVLIATREMQQELRASDPVSDKYGEPGLSIFGGNVIAYNWHLRNRAAGFWEYPSGFPKILSIVVAEDPFNLESTVREEFGAGADVLIAGKRSAEDYIDLINSWFGGVVDTRKHQGAYFNPERFRKISPDLLLPLHNYGQQNL